MNVKGPGGSIRSAAGSRARSPVRAHDSYCIAKHQAAGSGDYCCSLSIWFRAKAYAPYMMEVLAPFLLNPMQTLR